ncbi:MAG: RHS repeat-associated core domain-containing protein, partial [Prosthecobacter sp.]|nr:RHS repeat-associated core domain-containing protein [Prosthecobacter sp.]
ASAAGGPGGVRLSDFRYTGHWYHEKSELHLAPYRAYDAELGVWISEDPIQEGGGINLYGYVDNNSLSMLDILGHAKFPLADGKANINLGQGYSARVDYTPTLETHVYNPQGKEVGVCNTTGWINKHKMKVVVPFRPPPDAVLNKLNGVNIDVARRAGVLTGGRAAVRPIRARLDTPPPSRLSGTSVRCLNWASWIPLIGDTIKEGYEINRQMRDEGKSFLDAFNDVASGQAWQPGI